MFPPDPPHVPGLQAFRGRYCYYHSPLEKRVVEPVIDCSQVNCNGVFGSLIDIRSYRFHNGEIKPLPTIDQTLEYLSVISNSDGYLYPPQEVLVQIDGKTGDFTGIELPRSWKVARMFPLFSTHILIAEGMESKEEFRKGFGAFVLGLLSALFETRLQFHGWLVDSKVQLKRQFKNIHFSPKDVESFLTAASISWEKWPPKVRLEMLNVLNLFSKIGSYSATWENFTAAYLVVDGCFSIFKKLFRLKCNDKAQFQKVCEHFGIPFDKTAVDEIYRLRNDLFHSIKWDQGLFGFETGNGILRVSDLEKLSLRIIVGLCGYQSDFLRTTWTGNRSERL
jgi:hypothetical protein